MAEEYGSQRLLRRLQILAVGLGLLGVSSIPAAIKALQHHDAAGGHQISASQCVALTAPLTTALQASQPTLTLALQTSTTVITENAVCGWTGKFTLPAYVPNAFPSTADVQVGVYAGQVGRIQGDTQVSIIGLPHDTYQVGTTNQSGDCYIDWPTAHGSARVWISGLDNIYGNPECQDAASFAQAANTVLADPG